MRHEGTDHGFPPSTGTRSYSDDADGNTTAITGLGSNRSFAYDAFNHLSSVNNGGAVTNYSYNALGQRVRKTGAGGNLSYVYAPDGSLLGETASGGSTLATEYVWLPAQGGAPAQPIGVIRGNALYFVHDDHLGRPQGVTNASGTIVWQASNAAFDRSVTTNSFGGLNLGFPGQYYDQESGLYYNLNRYYDPTTGRYLQVDPIGLAGGVNPFVYVGNDPIRFIDPAGLDDLFYDFGSGVIQLPAVIVTASRLSPFFREDFHELGSIGLVGREGGGGGGGGASQGQQHNQQPNDCPSSAAADFARKADRFGSNLQAAGGVVALGGLGLLGFGPEFAADSAGGVIVGGVAAALGTFTRASADAFLLGEGDPRPLVRFTIGQGLSGLLPPTSPGNDPAGNIGDAVANFAGLPNCN